MGINVKWKLFIYEFAMVEIFVWLNIVKKFEGEENH